MLTLSKLQEIAKKQQTELRNIVREYLQHQFLSLFYQISGSEKLLFKGGTALRTIYQSPRFSEDLDFTGQHIYSVRFIDNIFLEVVRQIASAGLDIDLEEAKPTTGGYLGAIGYNIHGLIEKIRFEVSLRKRGKLKPELSTIISNFIPAYSILHLSGEKIVQGKVAALLDRKKPRDFYDFYFILRHPLLHGYISSNDLAKAKNLLEKSQTNFRTELGVLLPKSHHLILRDFKAALLKEIEKYV